MTPLKMYTDQKSHAKDRGIDFNLSYAQWLEMWLLSGKWENRGKARGQYQMCRYYDEGAYSTTNCYIGTVEDNQKVRHAIPDGETGSILRDWLSGVFTQQELGKRYSLTQSAISKIVNNKRRSHAVYT
jgi:hypothetical protein